MRVVLAFAFGVRHVLVVCCALVAACADETPPAVPPSTTELPTGWAIQSAAKVTAPDADVSRPGFEPRGWYPARVPSTVVGTLVDDGLFGDPFYARNLRTLPGMTYPVGAGFAEHPITDDSPFHDAWWYRTRFDVAKDARRTWVRFDGITYRAEIHVNGRRVADDTQIVGTFRTHELDITAAVTPGAPNALAVKVRAPAEDSLYLSFVDWNPAPPDKDMGLWGAVTFFDTGPVRMRWPHVASRIDGTTAHLSVTAELENAGDTPVDATLRARLDDQAADRKVTLAPHETRVVALANPIDVPHARLWWPIHMGAQNLYTMSLSVDVAGQRSDAADVRFGIREITSELTAENHRLFKVNGKPVLIRGAGWAPDMFLRAPPQRIEDELRYVEDMGLNAIRLEGKLGIDRLVDLADEHGILLLPGWCCCDPWEWWSKWGPEHVAVSVASLRDQIRRLRNHPSVLVWLNGSDNAPPPDVEKRYADVLRELAWPNPTLASANDTDTPVLGPSGVKMSGPYLWVPPNYWLEDRQAGGAFGFNTETSPGAAIPPLESLKKFIPPDHLWPIDDVWIFHSGSASFISIDGYRDALAARYGASPSVEDFAMKSQLAAYEGERAMFEAYARNKYQSTGVIQWMLNNAWPGIIWHLYDYYLKPGGGYFGAKKACEPVHIQYSYDDRSVVVVGSTLAPRAQLVAEASVRDLRFVETAHRGATIDLPADGRVVAFTLPPPGDAVYFVDLVLRDAAGQTLSRNFYWLPPRLDVLDYDNGTWNVTPVKTYADLTALATLPPATLTPSAATTRDGDDLVATVTLTNPSPALAFFVRVELTRGQDGPEALPVRWDDNYVSLRPGETRVLHARLRATDAGPAPALRVAGWNVAAAVSAL